MFSIKLHSLVAFLSLGALVTAQTGTFAIRGNINFQIPWVEVRGESQDVAINYAVKPNPGTATWNIQNVGSPNDPGLVTIFSSGGGFAIPLPGNPLVCGGNVPLLGTSFIEPATLWKLTPIGGNSFFITTNVTRANGQVTTLFWAMHETTGLLPLDASIDNPCNDAGFTSNIFQLLDPQEAS